ncbi:TraR/DksA family transcriptional regulator [Desulfobacca acetoxidans]|uniref:Transcriptional regulator, TraR/DksA family n=1 Tax=Desulfobacca acetoxidans (strain ATCC 700848 / DSM 11109 / ASRB2) TaxID=880072 RepID=F2NIP9_DESAR|nr:TraR/DksA C4-type zinc finger protein [Desulfobacca acetoxidans]AEB10524.1 transcriptional regulator, TraR/DksA family [Desulfobacca acetoxidans DSM 11109]HAY20879.1 molecular chaperone DnaK [Desulfobacterales bacterium]
MTVMDVDKMAELKERLLERKRKLWREVKGQIKSGLGESYQDLLATARDEEDQAQVSLLEETQFSLIEPKRQELIAIEEALERLEGGTYGECEVCGKPIEPRRLEIMPQTTLCRDCQSQREKIAKAGLR